MKAFSSSSRSSAAVQVRGVDGFDALGGAHQAHEPQALSARLLQPPERVDRAAARREHRVGHDHVRVAKPRREALEVVDGRVVDLVAVHAEMADAGIGQQAQEAVDHAQPRAQHRDDRDLAEQPPAVRGLERRVDGDVARRQVAGRLDREDRRRLLERAAERPVRGGAVPQHDEPVVEHGVLHHGELGHGGGSSHVARAGGL
jgi:hypothetical protein